MNSFPKHVLKQQIFYMLFGTQAKIFSELAPVYFANHIINLNNETKQEKKYNFAYIWLNNGKSQTKFLKLHMRQFFNEQPLLSNFCALTLK